MTAFNSRRQLLFDLVYPECLADYEGRLDPGDSSEASCGPAERPGVNGAEPANGPIQMMELEIVASVDLIVSPPLLGGAVTAGVEEPVQDGEEDGPLDGELEARPFSNCPMTCRQPVSSQSRWKTKAGPMCRTEMVGSLPWACSESTSTERARRAPETSKASSWPDCWS